MGFSRGLATGAQVGNSWVSNYKSAKLQRELADAGKFTPTEVASGEDALAAGLKAKQFEIDKIHVDDPEFESKRKAVEDNFAPTITGLEAQRTRGKSYMVQLPNGRRIEQDTEFTPEQMAGLRAEQSSRVFSELGMPEEAAKSTLTAQGIARNRMDMQKGELELKRATRDDKLHTRWHEEDDAYFSIGDPNLSKEEKEKKVKFLASRVGPLITADEDKFKGIKFKSLSDDASEVVFETKDGEGRAPLTMDMLHQGYAELAMRRDPQKFAEFQRKKLEFQETQAGLDRRNEGDNETRLRVGREGNASSERIASGNNAATVEAARLRRAGVGAGAHLTAEQNEQRQLEMDEIINSGHPPEIIAEKLNQLNVKYNIKSSHLKAGLSVGDLEKIHLMTDIPVKGETREAGLVRKRNHANSIHPGAGDKLYGVSEEVRYDAQGNAWVLGPDGKPVRKQ